MKKSTIFVVLLVYLVSFFIVGFLGIGIKSAFSVTYVSEITITELPDQPTLTLNSHERVENTTAEGEHNTFTNEYKYSFIYSKDTTLKFRVNVLPVESTHKDFEFINLLDSPYVTYDVKEDESLVFVTFSKRRAASFVIQSTDGDKTETTVNISAI